jgi:hypothetical protein
MRSDEALAMVRLNSTTEDTHPDYSDSVLLRMLKDALWQTFEDPIVVKRAGYWLSPFDQTVVSGQAKYRVTERACVGGLEMVELGSGTPPRFLRIPEVSQAASDDYELASGSLGYPRKFVMRGDQVVLLPTPDATALTVRQWYYRRPSRLVQQQSSTMNGGVIRGTVTAVSVGARTIQVDVVPQDMERVVAGVVTPTAITSGSNRIDVVHPYGWFDLALVGATQTLAATTFTVGGTDDMSEIRVGDFVRAAEQTDWPALPEDFHECLCGVTAVKVMGQRNILDKAAGFASSTSADLARLINILQPRVKSESLVMCAPLPGIRGCPAWYGPSFP